MKREKIVLIGAGLVGLFLLSGQAKDAAGGGGFGGGGEPSGDDVSITFPELDLSQIWGDEGMLETKKDIVMPEGGTTDYFGFGSMEAARASLEGQSPVEYFYNQAKISLGAPAEPPSISDVEETKKQMFTLPFFGATGAPTFSSWMKTHNIYGKRIASATAQAPSLAAKKAGMYPTKGLSGAARERYFERIAPGQQLARRIQN